ncbi:hypothetical protein F4780DRAFT_777260 [Xylariomycetidae sp. FL0641]|nr:hypothetical protein F4780DRAFT_777260 [Xylariomycetidae sp. FL0641]
MNNYAAGSLNEYAGGGAGGGNMHNLSVRPGATPARPGSRFAAPARNANNESADPWDRISDEHRNEINDCFHLFDMNKDDALDFSEFRYALQALGFGGSMSRAELIASFKSAARARPGWTPLPAVAGQPAPAPTPGVVDLRLGREGFQAVAARYVASRDPREELLKTFALFDRAGAGLVTADDLRAVVKELGEDVPDPELRSMVEQFDVEGKGGVSREEFVGIFLDR